MATKLEIMREVEDDQISNAPAKTRGQERMEMLQRYKEEKELRKLKEQREKPVFKCGRFKPEVPAFLPKTSQIPVLSKSKETVVKTASMEAPPVRVTRSKAKNQLQEPVKPQLSMKAPSSASKGFISQIPQQKQKQIYVDKLPRKETKEAPPVVSTTSNGRLTRAAAAVAKSKIPQVLRPATVTATWDQPTFFNLLPFKQDWILTPIIPSQPPPEGIRFEKTGTTST
ncbi:disks large-associated protein 5-like [Sceloporus undulatus]|uniref:disks large-associated protein 5-like n=1 Tax=Sceloporus undulatus TaxID=8520 RepID=UPI001C4D8560|nr:disks large-associated protein 5-like [Sceloporus undulatus]